MENKKGKTEEILERIKQERGALRPWQPIIASYDPDFTEMWHNVLNHALIREGAIPRKYKEIICVVMDAITFFEPGLRFHIQSALKNGATEEEVLEGLELATCLGCHPMTAHLAAFAEEVKKYKNQ
jgi:alkylhydroperoxidase/carboxymuconolactone decarboxylase family protein YurZ